jgi:hypothetical protein
MQKPTEDDDDDEASISTENEGEDPNLNDTFIVRRKAAKRTLPWDLSVDELELMSPQQAEDIRATKKPRLEEPISASTDEVATTISSHVTAVSLPTADADQADADADPVKGARATGYWAPEEDAKLTSGVTNNRKMKNGKEYGTDWIAIAALVPGRTKSQCRDRWRNALDPSMNQSNKRAGAWSPDENIKLKDAVQTHGGNNWGVIAALVPSRTTQQCQDRWRNALDPNINPTTTRAGKWSEDEDIKLKDAVQTHGGKNWKEVAALVQSRTNSQCRKRWHDALDLNIDRVSGRTGKWTAVENIKLKDAVQTHGGENWETIAALVPGRTKLQCSSRWQTILTTNIDPTMARTGKWTADEDIKLRNAVQRHGGKNWETIAMLVPGRTNGQCSYRWHDVLKSNIDQVTGRKSNWTADEDIKLKDAVQRHGGKNWETIAALVPGRTKKQCRKRWNATLIPDINSRRINVRVNGE